MKKIFTTISVLLISLSLHSQVTKSFMQTFRVSEGTSLSIELYGDIVLQKWDNDYIRVESNVTLDNGTIHTLDNLLSAGRYKISSSYENSNILLFNVPTQYRIKIGGKDLKEKFSYIIYVPSFSNEDDIQITFPESKEYTPTQQNQNSIK